MNKRQDRAVWQVAELADCGYVHDDKDGLRSSRQVQITSHGTMADNVPEWVEFQFTDIDDQPFTVEADLIKRFAHVPSHSEKPGATPFIYDIVENFAPLMMKESGVPANDRGGGGAREPRDRGSGTAQRTPVFTLQESPL
jgi:hypothetical protein